MIQVASEKYQKKFTEQKVAQFNEKSLILGRRFRKLPPRLFFEELFFGSQEYRIANFPTSPSGERIRTYESAEEMLNDAEGHSDAFYYPSDFLSERPYPRRKLLKKMYALIVDLDGVSPKAAKYIADGSFFGIIPTYLINSGGGLHLIFAFDEPVDCYDWTKALLNKMYTKLKKFFKRSSKQYIVDEGIGLLHAFRMPGTLTKYGCVCEAYRTGESWTAEKLASAMKMPWKTSQEPKKTFVQSVNKERTFSVQSVDEVKPNARRGFYENTKERMLKETPVGNRYLSMFALSIIAYKCNISRDILERDLEYIRNAYNNRDKNAHIVRTYEIGKAIRGYNPKATLVRRTTLNEWLGFEFEPAQRNGLSREEHISKVNTDRSNKAREAVEEYFRKNPDESNAKAARELGMSRNTVRKYRPMISESENNVEEEMAAQIGGHDIDILPPPVGVQPALHSFPLQKCTTSIPLRPLSLYEHRRFHNLISHYPQLDLSIRTNISTFPTPPKLLVYPFPRDLRNPENFLAYPKAFFKKLQYFTATLFADADEYAKSIPELVNHIPEEDEEIPTLEEAYEHGKILRHEAEITLAYLKAFAS